MIESNKNRLIKTVTKLKNKKYRDELGLFVLEGEKFVRELPDDWHVEEFVFSEEFSKNVDMGWYKNRASVNVVSDGVFKTLSDTVTPQGVLCVCKQKSVTLDFIENENAFMVIGECMRDPGNLGTLIRTADAANCIGVILSKGSVDVYNPKVLRATAGSIFHLPIITDVNLFELIPKLKQLKINIVAAHLKGSKLPYELNLKKSCAILIGNEGSGLTDEISNQATELVKIPMPGQSESLNASVATGILLYEVVRQRLNIS